MGDDAAGILVIQRLKASLPAGSFLIPIEAGPAPENFTGQVRKHHPGLVVFIDAGDIGGKPGTVGLFTCEQGEGISAFGHTLPLGVLGQYLEKELSCECLMLIIQPGRIDFDLPVTREVQEAVDVVTQGWLEISGMA
jgi:hydrogenase 3 maturation protease